MLPHPVMYCAGAACPARPIREAPCHLFCVLCLVFVKSTATLHVWSVLAPSRKRAELARRATTTTALKPMASRVGWLVILAAWSTCSTSCCAAALRAPPLTALPRVHPRPAARAARAAPRLAVAPAEPTFDKPKLDREFITIAAPAFIQFAAEPLARLVDAPNPNPNPNPNPKPNPQAAGQAGRRVLHGEARCGGARWRRRRHRRAGA